MAIRIQLFDGSLLEFPDNTPQDVIDRVAKQETLVRQPAPQARPVVEPPKQEGLGAAFGKGLESLLSSGRTAIGAFTGSPEEAALAALEREKKSPYADQVSLEKVSEAAKRGLLPAAGEVARQVPLAIMEQAPNVLATLGSAKAGYLLGAKAGTAIAPGVGTVVGGIGGGILGAIAPSLLQQFGGNIQRQAQEQQAQGKPIDISRTAAGLAAVPQAGLDVAASLIPLGRTFAGKVLGPQVEELLKRGSVEGAERLARESLPTVLGKGAAISIATEVPTEVIQTMLERSQAGLALTTPDALAEYGNVAYQAGLLAPIGAVGRVGERAAARSEALLPGQRRGESDMDFANRLSQEIGNDRAYVAVQQAEQAESAKRQAALEKMKQAIGDGLLTPEVIKQWGFGKGSIFDSLVNKNLSNPEDASFVADVLSAYRAKAHPNTQVKIDDALAGIEAMFGAKPTPQTEGEADVGAAITEPSGAGVQVAGEPDTGAATPRLGAPEPAGVVPPVEDVGQPAGGAEAAPPAVTPPVAPPVVEPVKPVETPATEAQAKEQHAVQGLPIIEAPLEQLTLSKDVPQFKSDADEKGVVEKLGGKFDRTGVAPIQVWRRTDGRMEVISGRHRLDLAQRSGEATIPAQIHDEAQGFDAKRAAMLDAELNIRDQQGKVKDYVNYFENAGISQADADSRGLLARPPGRQGFAIATQGSPDLIASHRANVVNDAEAFGIASAAPGDARLQALGIKAVSDGKNVNGAVNMMKAVKALAAERGVTEEAGDLFGFDDSAMREAEEMAKIASRKQSEVANRLSAISGASKRPEVAKKEGIDIKDPEALKLREKQLRQQKASWDNWSSSPELIQEIKAEMVKPSLAEAAPQPLPITPEIQEKIDQLEKVLKKIMNKYGLKDVALKLIDDMKAEGEYAQSVVRLALDAVNPVQALRHESIHALKELGFFSPQQWAALEKQAKSKWIDQYLKTKNINKEDLEEGQKSRYDAYMELYKGDMDAIIEEAIADAFGDFDVNKAPPGLMQAILTRLRNFFDAVKTAFGGEVTAEQVFRKVEKGSLKAEAKAEAAPAKPSLRPEAAKWTDEQIDEAVANGFSPVMARELRGQQSLFADLSQPVISSIGSYWKTSASLESAVEEGATRAQIAPLKAAETRAFKQVRNALIQAKPELAGDPAKLNPYLANPGKDIGDYLDGAKPSLRELKPELKVLGITENALQQFLKYKAADERVGSDPLYAKPADKAAKTRAYRSFMDEMGGFDSAKARKAMYALSMSYDMRGEKSLFAPEEDLFGPAAKPSLRDAAKIDINRSLNDKRISPRMPTAVKAKEETMGEVRLQPDLDTFKRDDAAFRHNIGLMSQYPNFVHIKGRPDQRAEQMIDHMKDNLLWLFNSWDQKLRDRSKLWYVGGNRISHRWAEKYGIPAEQAAGIIAALSPQKDWFQNVSLAERTLDALVFNADTMWSPEMTNVFKERAWAKKFPLRKYQGTTLKDMYKPGDAKSLVDMSVWIRAWDEANNPQMARVITPEGTFTNEMAAGKTGKPVAMRAQSFAAMVKTLQVLQQSDLQVISDLIGKNHKVRSFYNNIIAPYAGDDVTIDTHAVAAALLRPLGSSDLEVYHNFGSAKPAKKDKEGNILIPASAGTKNSAVTGLYGTYAMYAEAYRRASQDAGVLPREMQSITWEAIRGLFRPEQKQARLKQQTNVLWNKAGKGEINGQSARDQISKLVSGIEDPAWARSPVGANESPTDSSYAEKLSGTSVPGREPGRVPSGVGERVAGAVPKLSLRVNIPPSARARVVATTVTRQEKGFVERLMEAISPSSYSDFRAQALNRYNQLGVYDKIRAKKMGGAALLADSSAESAALLSDLGAGLTASALGVHDRMGGIPVYKNGITIISNQNGTIKGPTAIFAPLAGDPSHYQAYQYWAGVKRGSRFLADGREELFNDPNDKVEAEKIRKAFLKEGIDFETIQKEWIKYNDGLVQYMVDTGVLSADRADSFRKHGDYLPFYRQMTGQETVGPKVFQAISGVKPPKKLKGGEAMLDDFLEAIVRNTQAAIQAGVKNVAAQRAAKVAMDINMARPLGYKSSAPNTFDVLENGKAVTYIAQDQLFINAIKSLGIPDLPFIGLLSGPANLLRNLVTKDPGFMLANLMRDSMSAWVTSGVKMKPVVDTITNFGSAIAGKDPAFQALMNAGILGGYEFSQNVEQSGREFGSALRKQAKIKSTGIKGVVEMGTKPFTSLWDALEKGTTASDAATRMEVYKRTLAETGNEAEALFKALEVMNFNRKGSSAVVRILTAAVPFLNARMQGLDVLYRAASGQMNARDAAQIQKQFFVRGAMIASLSGAYWLLTHDDEEYKKQEQETRDNYWLLPSLGIKIPIPFEIGVLFKVIPERILGYTFGSDTGEDFLKSMARQLTSTLAFNPIPQAVMPVVETMTNFSFFTMRPIVGQGLEGLQPAYQVGPGTSRLAEGLGEMTKGMAKELQVSPAKIDQLISGYTGTMGMYLMNLMDAVYDMNTDSPKPARRFEQMPLIRRFAVDPEARGNVTAYYELKNSVDSIVRTSNMLERTMNYEELPGYMMDNMKMLASKDYILDLEKTMKEFREMKIMIRSASMDANAKRDAILSIDQMENQLTSNIQYMKKLAKGD